MDTDTFPSYNDGLNAVSDLTVTDLNNGASYITFDGDPSEGADVKKYVNADNNPLGSKTNTMAREGSLNLQYTLGTDELPGATNEVRPGHILLFRQRYYIAGSPKNKIVKNEMIKFSVSVLEVINPIVSPLLSVLGQQKAVTANANSVYTLSCVAVNTRTAATVAYSVQTWPTGAAPAGVAINATSGSLTANVAAGTYEIQVNVSDTVTGNSQVNHGWGRLTLTAA